MKNRRRISFELRRQNSSSLITREALVAEEYSDHASDEHDDDDPFEGADDGVSDLLIELLLLGVFRFLLWITHEYYPLFC